jgi:hypothetical protein
MLLDLRATTVEEIGRQWKSGAGAGLLLTASDASGLGHPAAVSGETIAVALAHPACLRPNSRRGNSGARMHMGTGEQVVARLPLGRTMRDTGQWRREANSTA